METSKSQRRNRGPATKLVTATWASTGHDYAPTLGCEYLIAMKAGSLYIGTLIAVGHRLYIRDGDARYDWGDVAWFVPTSEIAPGKPRQSPTELAPE